jgi:hypothetical protein
MQMRRNLAICCFFGERAVADSAAAVNTEPNRIDQLAGVILGTAVGDALGLPREGLSPRSFLGYDSPNHNVSR